MAAGSPASRPSSAPEGTREALLDAAEDLFARKGVPRASLRAITQTAGANLAAVHYHFGSKEGLVRAVLSRRLGPLNRERLARLAACDPGPGGTPEPRALVTAFVAPVLEMIQRQRGGHAFAQFVLRAFSEPGEETRELMLEEFGEVIERFTDAFARALPQFSREDVFWRYFFMVGSLAFAAGLGFLIRPISAGRCNPLDVDDVTRRLVDFITGGMLAPGSAEAATR